MNLPLKKILKHSNLLYLSSNDKLCKKTINISKVFFKKIIYSDDINKAVSVFNNNLIHLIISEIDLRESNGIEFIKEIRKINNKIPIIVLTENKKIETLLEAVKLNLMDYIIKPTDTNKLLSAYNRSAKKIFNSGSIINNISKSKAYNYLEKTFIINDLEIKLTKNEAVLFELLLSNKNRIVKIKDIKKYVWGNKEVSDSAFKTLFSRLINKIGKDTITNSFGVGYGIYDIK